MTLHIPIGQYANIDSTKTIQQIKCLDIKIFSLIIMIVCFNHWFLSIALNIKILMGSLANTAAKC